MDRLESGEATHAVEPDAGNRRRAAALALLLPLVCGLAAWEWGFVLWPASLGTMAYGQCAHLYEDLNGNGRQDPGEPVLHLTLGVTVVASPGARLLRLGWLGGEAITVTGPTPVPLAECYFGAAGAGTFHLTFTLPPIYAATTPLDADVTLPASVSEYDSPNAALPNVYLGVQKTPAWYVLAGLAGLGAACLLGLSGVLLWQAR